MLDQQNCSFSETKEPQKINEWLRETRNQHYISLQQMSRFSSISVHKLSKMESGKGKVDILTLVAYCQCLGISMQQVPFFNFNQSDIGKNPSLNEEASILRAYRKARGLSLRKLAERMGRNHVYFYRIESRKTRFVAVDALVVIDQLLEANGKIFLSYWNWECSELDRKESELILQMGAQYVRIPKSMKEIGSRDYYWQTVLAPILWCVAVLGFSTNDDIAWKLNCDKVQLNRGLKRLVERGFLNKKTTTILHTVNLYSMTTIGKTFCQNELGWQVIESDFERMIRLHQGDVYLRHTALCLEFATKARKAGYKVELVPEIPFQDDDNTPLIHYL